MPFIFLLSKPFRVECKQSLGSAAIFCDEFGQRFGSQSTSWRGSPYCASCGGVCAGTRNSSAAQAPRSMFLQRWLQKGRHALEGAKRLGPLQVGHCTVGGVEVRSLMRKVWHRAALRRRASAQNPRFLWTIADCRFQSHVPNVPKP